MALSLPENWKDRLTLPVIAAPMFLISGPELVKACCLNGIVGSFPAPNARPIEMLDEWMGSINETLTEAKHQDPDREIAPWAMNMVVHSTYSRLEEELELVRKHKPPIVLTSLGSPKKVAETVHEYGGLVFSDVSSIPFARKAAEAGVDGLILVAAGAGGHAGDLNNFAFVDSVRTFWDGMILLAGSISTGRSILAAQAAGADLAYMGTRFIVAKESRAADDYRDMLIQSGPEDVILTDAFSGVNCNMLKPSIEKAGLDPEQLIKKESVNFDDMSKQSDAKAWRDIWSAGHGVGAIRSIDTAAGIIHSLRTEYEEAYSRLNASVKKASPSSIG